MDSSSSVDSSRVPQELIDQFIDHLHDDQAALKACCMVSRSWRPSSQFHLFNSISVAESSTAFIDFLTTTPHVAPYIHHLCFYPAPKNGRITTIICPLHVIPVILSLLPQLVSLELYRMCSVCLCEHPAQHAPASRPINKLLLHNIASYDHDAREGVVQLLGIFSSIQYLQVLHKGSVRSNRQTSFPSDEFIDPLPSLHLDRVLFNSINFGFICFSLVRSSAAQSLQHIDATIHHNRDTEALSKVLSEASQSLQSVTLDICPVLRTDPSGQQQSLVVRGLADCAGLESLTFVVGDWRDDAAYCQRICDSLTLTLSLEGLGARHICFQVHPVDKGMTMFFDRLEYETCKRSLAKVIGLQEITFQIVSKDRKAIAKLEESLVHQLVPKGVALSIVGGLKPQ